MKKRFIRKADVVLLIFLVIIGIAGSLYISMNTEAGSKVVIKLDGKEYGTYNLNEDRTIEVKTSKSDNILVIKNGTVYMSEATCKNQVCVEHSPISTTGESIVCLPNKVMIKIESGSAKGDEIDSVSK